MKNILNFKNMKIKAKLIAVSLLISLVPIAIIGMVAFKSGSSSLMGEILNSLEENAINNMDKIDRNLFERYGDVQAFTAVPTTSMALEGRSDDLEQLPDYINSVTAIYGIYDLMIVADKNGRVVGVNSVDPSGRTIDTSALLGTSVAGDKWFRDSVSGSVKNGQSYVEDYHLNKRVSEIYGKDSYNMIFATPVRNSSGTIIGVWANYAGIGVINEIADTVIKDKIADGTETINVTILNKDGLIIYDNKIKEQVFKTNLIKLDVETAKLAAIKGAEGSREGYHARRKVVTLDGYVHSGGYSIYPGVDWSMLVRIDEAEGLEPVAQLRNYILIIAVVAAAIVGFVAFIFSLSISRPIQKVADAAKAMADGHLGIKVDVSGKDETGILAESFNTMSENMKGLIQNISQASGQLASSAEEISAATEQMAAGAQNQTKQTDQVATAVEEMSATVLEVAKNSNDASESARKAADVAKGGGEVVSKTIDGMNRISASVMESARTIEALGKSSDEIGEIIAVIDDIADQTNLLALNAAIEAARAGEQGRGFAVVADEVRKLAERTTKATKEIAAMIKSIQSDTDGAVKSMSAGTEEVEKGVSLANEAGGSLDQIVEVVTSVTDMIQQIATAAEEQSAAAEEISTNVEAVASITKETATGANQSSVATQELTKLASELQQMVGQFRLS